MSYPLMPVSSMSQSQLWAFEVIESHSCGTVQRRTDRMYLQLEKHTERVEYVRIVIYQRRDRSPKVVLCRHSRRVNHGELHNKFVAYPSPSLITPSWLSRILP